MQAVIGFAPSSVKYHLSGNISPNFYQILAVHVADKLTYHKFTEV